MQVGPKVLESKKSRMDAKMLAAKKTRDLSIFLDHNE